MGRNALHLVALSDERDFQSVIKFLIDNGADVTCEDKVTCSPFVVKRFMNLKFRTERSLINWRKTAKSGFFLCNVT